MVKPNKKQTKKNANLLCGYEIIEKIGKGSHGQVYKVKDSKGNIFAAKKYLDEWVRYDINLLELEILSTFKHDNIISSERFFTPENCKEAKSLVIIIDHADQDLSTFSEQNKDYSKILRYCYQIFSGVNFFHSKNILHLDLKCQNIVLTKGIAKIIDFGAACKADEGFYWREYLTTVNYRTPENIFKEVSKKRDFYFSKDNDIWAATLIFVYLIFGERVRENRELLNFYRRLTLESKQQTIKEIVFKASRMENFRKTDGDKLTSFLDMILHYEAKDRPNIKKIMSHEIFNGFRIESKKNYVISSILFEKGDREGIKNVIFSILHIMMTKDTYDVFYLFLAIELVYRLYPNFSYNTNYLTQAVAYLILNFNRSSSNMDDYSFLNSVINYLGGNMIINFLYEKCKNLKALVFAWRKILFPIVLGNYQIYENYDYKYFDKDLEKFNFIAKNESKIINIRNFSKLIGVKLVNKELKF